MADLAVTFTFAPNTTASSSQANTNFSDVTTYINNRDDGTATWDNCNVTATVANPVTIKSSASTTEVAIDNTATTGDPQLTFKLSGTAKYSLGVDDSASDNFVIAASSALGTTNAIAIDSSANTFVVGVLNAVGSGNSFIVDTNVLVVDSTNDLVSIGTASPSSYNTSARNLVIRNSSGNAGMTLSANTNASNLIGFSDAESTTLAGLITYDHDATATNETLSIRVGGVDDVLKLNGNSQVQALSGTAALPSISFSTDPDLGFYVRAANSIGFAGGGVEIGRLEGDGTAGVVTTFGVTHPDNTNTGSHARSSATAGGTSGGDPFTLYAITSGQNWAVGVDNSDSDKFKISRGSTMGSGDIITASATTFDPVGAGTISTGDASNYWNDISYKTLTDRGCLGFFDEGVELQDGRIVPDTEALLAIQKHPTKKTIYGADMLDYRTFPKVAYVKAKVSGAELERDANNEAVGGEDGIEMTSMFSIMIGAIKELTNRVKALEAI